MIVSAEMKADLEWVELNYFKILRCTIVMSPIIFICIDAY